MRGETTIEFDFPIEFSHGGEWKESTTITVRAPGFKKVFIHAKMDAFVTQAIFNMQKSMLASDPGTRAKGDEPEVEAGDDEDVKQNALQIMAAGLGTKDYPEFFEFVQTCLTNNPSLAFVGPEEFKAPLTDGVWESLHEHGGFEAVQKVMAAFTDFFFAAIMESPRKSGRKRSATSASATKAPSRKNGRGSSPSPN